MPLGLVKRLIEINMASIKSILFKKKGSTGADPASELANLLARLQGHDSEAAVTAVERLVQEGDRLPADPGVYLLAVDIARQNHRADLAGLCLDKCGQRHEATPQIQEKVGFLALERKEADAAANAFRSGVELDPEFLPNWYGLALAEFDRGSARAAM